MEILINQLLSWGARRNKLEAKVFGGGNVLRGFTVNNVGDRNAAFVLDFLKTEKIPGAGAGPDRYLSAQVYFVPQSGKVMVKKLRSMHNITIVKREIDYSQKLRTTRVSGDVELFG